METPPGQEPKPETKLPTEPEKNLPNVDIKEPGADSHDYMFFNVMPKNKNAGGIIEPTVKSEVISAPAAATPKSGFGETFKKFKLYFILGGAVIILAPAIYFGMDYFGGAQYPTDDLLIVRDTKPKPTKTAGDTFTTPKDWRDKYFTNCTDANICGDGADADHDGLTNLQEYKGGLDPNNPDSDQDGLADGDEINVFESKADNSHTTKNAKFNDADYVKGAFSFVTDKKMTEEEIKAVSAKMASFGLHLPTPVTLEGPLTTIYKFGQNASSTPENTPTPTPTASTTPTSLNGVDMSLSAKQDRDTKRSNTIKNIEIAIVKYEADNNKYPDAANFTTMFNMVKPYLKVATNPKDPIDQDPYVYSYSLNSDKSDFTLTFYSEVAAGPISKHAKEAQADANLQNAETYDNQIKMDLEDMRTALLLYSQANIAGNQVYVFPTIDKYKTALVPNYISAIPVDPVSKKDYEYTPSQNFDAFTLKATLQNPPPGNTGFLCNQVDECNYY